jgi:hypothetical protein
LLWSEHFANICCQLYNIWIRLDINLAKQLF